MRGAFLPRPTPDSFHPWATGAKGGCDRRLQTFNYSDGGAGPATWKREISLRGNGTSPTFRARSYAANYAIKSTERMQVFAGVFQTNDLPVVDIDDRCALGDRSRADFWMLVWVLRISEGEWERRPVGGKFSELGNSAGGHSSARTTVRSWNEVSGNWSVLGKDRWRVWC